MKNVKILIISTVGLSCGGIASVIYNYANAMNRDGLELHFVSYGAMNEKQKLEFQKIGFLYCVHDRKTRTKEYIKDLRWILSGKYDVIHIHGNSGTMAVEAVLAKVYSVKKIIVHCHNTSCDHKVLNVILKFPMKLCATDFLACSDSAGKWLYGNREFVVLNNAVDIDLFRYDKEKRTYFRRKYGLGNSFVIGHSGRFHEQKNHMFLIDIFIAYLEKDPSAKLLLVGGGPMLEMIRLKVRSLGVGNSVIFTGERNDVNEIYNAMDMFLLPSLWEGLPLVMIEAQANGLPLLVSDCITQKAKCTQRTFYFDLKKGAQKWADKIQEIKERAFEREENDSGAVRNKGFDIRYEANTLRKIYLK